MAQLGTLQRFPTKRLVATDGAAVTADVWNQAHDYQRNFLAAHLTTAYGAGVITGLEVIADTPPGQYVHVSPGVAIDHHGQTIVVPTTQAYNLRNQEGTIYLVLTYSEGTPRPEPTAEGADAPHFAPVGYSLEAKTTLPAEPYVELARIRRPPHTIPVANAKNPEAPGTCEIDLRFRGQAALTPAQPLLVAVNVLDGQVAAEHLSGWQNLIRELRHTTRRPFWVEQNVSLEGELSTYPLLCLVGQQNFELSRAALTRIHDYLLKGGILFFESCRRTLRRGSPEADGTLERVVSGMGSRLVEAPADHPLLRKPYFFPQLPAGYDPRSGGTLRIAQGIGKGLILHSTYDYGCLWAGDRSGQRLTRDEVRSAFEWGENLLTFAIDQRRQHE